MADRTEPAHAVDPGRIQGWQDPGRSSPSAVSRPSCCPIDHRWQLTYEHGRDGVSFADDLMESVARFMEDLLQAFEDHVPTRFRNV
jgi:hypothetical protein